LIFFAKVEFIINFQVFEITPKEQLLKNIRKGLVQPLPNKYPLLNFEKDVLKKTVLLQDESFIKNWVESGYFFSEFKGLYDLLRQLSGLQVKYGLGIPAIEEKGLIELFAENSIPYLPIDKADKTILCGFSKLENTTHCACFSSELHPVRYFKNTEYLVLYGKASQIDNPANNRFFSDMIQKNDLRIQLHIDFFKSFKSVFLFIDEQA
jgi:hypothetical protein